MDVDFNTSQFPRVKASAPVIRPGVSNTVGEASPSQNLDDLKQKLGQLPLERADEVAQATALAHSTSYPPDEILNRIAVLLAIHLTQ